MMQVFKPKPPTKEPDIEKAPRRHIKGRARSVSRARNTAVDITFSPGVSVEPRKLSAFEKIVEKLHLDREVAELYWPIVKHSTQVESLLSYFCEKRSKCFNDVNKIYILLKDIDDTFRYCHSHFSTNGLLALLQLSPRPSFETLEKINRFRSQEVVFLFNAFGNWEFIMELSEASRKAEDYIHLRNLSFITYFEDIMNLESYSMECIKDIEKLVKDNKEFHTLIGWGYSEKQIKALSSCIPLPSIQTLSKLKTSRFSFLDTMEIFDVVVDWDYVYALSQLVRPIEGIKRLLKMKPLPKVDQMSLYERFSTEEIITLIHKKYVRRWGELIQLANSNRSFLEIEQLFQSAIRPTVSQISNTQSFTVAEISENLKLPRGKAALDPWKELKQLSSSADKFRVVNAAMAKTRQVIKFGPGNQDWSWGVKKPGDVESDRGFVRMQAHFALKNFLEQQRLLTNVYIHPRRLGALVETTGGGNCQDYAALTYNYLRDQAKFGWVVCYVESPGAHHVFATIGDPDDSSTPKSSIVVADAWVEHPRPVTLDHHFCGQGPLRVLKRAGARTKSRTGALKEKYPALKMYNPDSLEQWYRYYYKIPTRKELIDLKYLWGNRTPD